LCNNECIFQMTKKIKKLEKEATTYRQRWENSNKALLTMAEEVSGSFVCKNPMSVLLSTYILQCVL